MIRFFITFILSFFIFGETLIGNLEARSCDTLNDRSINMNRFGRGRCRGMGRGRFRGPGCGGSGPYRDGRGPNPDCPLKKERRDALVDDQNSNRLLKRDGTGPNKDGQGPGDSNLGPRENCPKKG